MADNLKRAILDTIFEYLTLRQVAIVFNNSFSKKFSNICSKYKKDYSLKFDLSKLKLINKSRTQNIIWSLISYKNDQVLIGSDDSSIKLCDMKTLNLIKFIGFHPKNVTALFRLRNNIVISGSSIGSICFWDIENENDKLLKTLQIHKDIIWDIIDLSDNRIMTISEDTFIKILDISTFSIVISVKTTSPLCTMININKKCYATGAGDDYIRIWKYENNSFLTQKTFKAHSSSICALVKVCHYLISGGIDQKIKIWDLNNYQCVQELEGHEEGIIGMITCDPFFLISASFDGIINIWDLLTFERIIKFDGHLDVICSIDRINEDTFYSTSSNQDICLWNFIKD